MDAIKQTTVGERPIAISTTKRVASNFLWSIVSEAITKGVFFLTTIYLARNLGVSNFGLFTLAQTITLYFWLAVDMGTNMSERGGRSQDKEEVMRRLRAMGYF